MIDLQQLQILAQLVDNLEIVSEKLEKAYSKNNKEEYNKAKLEILNTQKKIDEIIK